MAKIFLFISLTCIFYSSLCSTFEINPRTFLQALSESYNGTEINLPDNCFGNNFSELLNTLYDGLLNTYPLSVLVSIVEIYKEYNSYCPKEEINTLLTNVYNSCIFFSIPKYSDLYQIVIPFVEEYFKEEHKSSDIGKLLGIIAKILDKY